MKVTETVRVAKSPEETYALLTQPERRGGGEGWRAVERSDDGYAATLDVTAGATMVTFDCRFTLHETQPGSRIRVQGIGVSPRAGFTFVGDFEVQRSDGASSVDVEADVTFSGPLAGLGQRVLHQRLHRFLAAYFDG
jgi:carbon monoxide dehydrogenase subunit G